VKWVSIRTRLITHSSNKHRCGCECELQRERRMSVPNDSRKHVNGQRMGHTRAFRLQERKGRDMPANDAQLQSAARARNACALAPFVVENPSRARSRLASAAIDFAMQSDTVAGDTASAHAQTSLRIDFADNTHSKRRQQMHGTRAHPAKMVAQPCLHTRRSADRRLRLPSQVV